jgi:hypothetical protein
LPDVERLHRLQAGDENDQTNDQRQDWPANENVGEGRFHGEKSEIRISKFETNSKFECSNEGNDRAARLLASGFKDLDIRICFEF